MATLLIEDVEDLYIFGTLMVGMVLIGMGTGLTYWKLRITAYKVAQELAVLTRKWITEAGDRNTEVSRKVDTVLGMNAELNRKMDTTGQRIAGLSGHRV